MDSPTDENYKHKGCCFIQKSMEMKDVKQKSNNL